MNKDVDLNTLTFGLRTGQEYEYVTQCQSGLGRNSMFFTSLSVANVIALQPYSFF
jgi:hypothetical protein